MFDDIDDAIVTWMALHRLAHNFEGTVTETRGRCYRWANRAGVRLDAWNVLEADEPADPP